MSGTQPDLYLCTLEQAGRLWPQVIVGRSQEQMMHTGKAKSGLHVLMVYVQRSCSAS